jgi:hypothetical protein
LEASQQFSFLQGRVISPTPNPHPGGAGLYIYIPQRQGGYPFYSPLTTCMGYSGTILIPGSPHGEFHFYYMKLNWRKSVGRLETTINVVTLSDQILTNEM